MSSPNRPPRIVVLVLSVSVLFLLSGNLAGAISRPTVSSPTPAVPAPSLAMLQSAPLVGVSDTEPGLDLAGSVNLGASTNGSLPILVSFPIQNQSRLGSFLTALSDPTSPRYHEYLSAAQFDVEFGGAPGVYRLAQQYFASFGVGQMQTFADRLTLTFVASPLQVAKIFHVAMDRWQYAGRSYVAALGTPTLPEPLALGVTSVEGLSTYSTYLIHPLDSPVNLRLPPAPHSAAGSPVTGYLAPPTSGTTQLEYGPDFQVTYDEQSLFNDSGFPRNAVIATILWAGSNGTVDVGPFVPADIYDFYNETIPVGEPHAHVYGVPLLGAMPPGPSASYDETGAWVENTLDLEMAGSTAPGASIYNVYGPQASNVDIDDAFAYILNPTSTPALNNVSAISNSWGSSDGNDTNWYNDLIEAQARGITVLASSGDSGDNPSSSKYLGGPDYVEFPSAMAYDAFGMVAVGGTTVTMNADSSSSEFLHLSSQTAWYDSANMVGSTGGVSSVFQEPSWQLDTSAASVIASAGLGNGRGVPDISAVANNTLMTLTEDGYQYQATNATYGGYYVTVGGTSVASPLVAGIVAEIDHVLRAHSNGNLGFLDPELYALANTQYSALSNLTTTGYVLTGPYASALPTLPFLDVVTGSNALYSAQRGYDLVTGWGSLDAYNYTMYFLEVSSSGVYGRLSGVGDNLTLSDLKVTTPGNDAYNASIQQNFFLADSLGAPVYWVQNVIYITNVPGGWEMDYTGWVVYPFYGIYPSLTVYEYNFPSSLLVDLPSTFNVTTQLVAPAGFDTQSVNFFVGSHEVSLPVPGASYIIGSLSYSYSWQGVNYTNGPFPDNPTPGGLSPQFGLVGGPSGGTGDFMSPTSGSLTAEVEPFGSSTFEAASTESYGEDITQTGETAENLAWTQTTADSWTLGISSGSSTQGVLAYEPNGYNVTFSETGLPSGTSWSVTLGGVQKSSTTSTIEFGEESGTYPYTIGGISGWHQTTLPYTGSVVVSGASVVEPTLVFARVTYPVSFSETGLPLGAKWYVNFTSGPTGFALPRGSASAGSAIVLDLFNGSYRYTVTSNAPRFETTSPASLTESAGTPATVSVTFSFTYPVSFSESGLPTGTSWSVTLAGTLEHSTTRFVNFTATNGTWSYLIGDVSGWHQDTLPYAGSVDVSGASVSEPTLEFVQVNYTVTFQETGLPAGTEWSVDLASGGSYETSSNLLTFDEPNGSYDYSIATAEKIYSAAGGSFQVAGSSLEESAAFGLVTFQVTFTETGLPSGDVWFLNVTGDPSRSTGGNTLAFDEPNATYVYALASANKEYSARTDTGSFSVSGAPESVTVTFVEVEFDVSFSESGLPPGSSWSVTLGGSTLSSTSATIVFAEPNGSLSYAIQDVAGWHQTTISYAGTVLIAGGPLVLPALEFQQVAYSSTFTETGLPMGTQWWVNLSSGPSASSSTGALSLAIPNGTYDYVVASSDKRYAGTPGSFAVQGSGADESVLFSPMSFRVVFVEEGLPAGTAWSITLGGVVGTSENGTITFSEQNGSLSFVVGSLSGYSSSPGSGTVLVSGPPASITIQFSTAASAHTTSIASLAWETALLVGVAIVAVAVGLVLAVRRGRKGRPPVGSPPGSA